MTAAGATPSSAASVPVGIVGLGLVGLALAQRLLRAGYAVAGCDIDPARVQALQTAGGIAAPAPADVAAACNVVFLALYDGDQTREVVASMEALLRAGTVVVDCGTADFEDASVLAQQLRAHGVAFLDAPLSGSSAQIAAGDAVMLAGGDRAAYERIEPMLDAIAAQRFHLGEAGAGQRAKLATNLLLGLNRAALAEALAFAEALQVHGDTFLDVLRATPAYSRAVDTKGRRMVERNYVPESRIRQHRKDVALMQQVAARTGFDLPLTRAHAALLDAAIAAGHGDLDNAAIVEALRAGPGTALPDTGH
jgi:3-hydroxyisobutyrate dehydrogenase-like beta-hydroxyacid dehydrogenase